MSNYEVILKPMESMQVISIRETLPNYPGIGRLFDELMGYLNQHGVKSGDYYAAIWHDPEYKLQDVDGEAVISVKSPVSGSDRIQAYELPGIETAACTIHHGSYKTLNLAYNAILEWIDANGYQIVGPNREFYIQSGPEQDNESYVTELQFPVMKA